MPAKTAKASKSVKRLVNKGTAAKKAAIKKTVAKTRITAKKTVAKSKTTARAAARKLPTQRRVRKAASGLVDQVKDGVQSGLDAVGRLVKKVTPDALLPKSSRKR